jgi:hypothetical protein
MVYQSPLGKTLQLRRAFDKIGIKERMAANRIAILPGKRTFVCHYAPSGVIPKPALSPAGRGISRLAANGYGV